MRYTGTYIYMYIHELRRVGLIYYAATQAHLLSPVRASWFICSDQSPHFAWYIIQACFSALSLDIIYANRSSYLQCILKIIK